MKPTRSNTACPVVCAILGALTLQSCAPPTHEADEVVLPFWQVEFGNPQADADAAYRRGDQHLLGIRGYSISVPGAPEEEMPPGWPGDLRSIVGTSDMIGGPWQEHFMDRATIYARAYNRELLQKKPTRSVGLCVRTANASAGTPALDAKIVTSSGNIAWDEEARRWIVSKPMPSDMAPWAHVCVGQPNRTLTCPEFDCGKAFGGDPDPHAGGR